MYIYLFIYIYICIYIMERERERERDTHYSAEPRITAAKVKELNNQHVIIVMERKREPVSTVYIV